MASDDWQVTGQQLAGKTRAIFSHQNGIVRIKLREIAPRDTEGKRLPGNPRATSIYLDADQRAEFSRLLAEVTELAATPGHPLTVAAVTPGLAERMGEIADAAQDVVTKDEVDRCGWSEDPYHRCRVCYDYAAGRDRDHPLIADAAQEAGDE